MSGANKKKRCKLISFSGIDGAGKGTQIDTLRAHLIEAGLRVRLIPFWDEVARLTRLREVTGHKLFKGDKGVGSPDRPINRRDKNVRSWPMSQVRLGLYLLDTLSLRTVVKRAQRSGADVVICDRYAFDELANLDLDTRTARAYARAILKIAPKPDIAFLLDADPIQARARKPEYPVEFLQKNRTAYLALSKMAEVTVIPAAAISNVTHNVLQCADREILSGTQFNFAKESNSESPISPVSVHQR